VNVTATAAYDFYVDAAYAEIAVDKTFTITDSTSLVLKAAAGYSLGGYYTVINGAGFNEGNESVWTHVVLNASLPIALNSTFTLTPYIAYNMSGAGREETNLGLAPYGADKNQFFCGASVKAVF
jgi:hypothetical protein